MYEIPKDFDVTEDEQALKVKMNLDANDIDYQPKRQNGNMLQGEERITFMLEVMIWMKWVGMMKTVALVAEHGVGEKKANGYGLYDMSGNVYEWCWDSYGVYEESKAVDPTGDSSSSNQVYRGSLEQRREVLSRSQPEQQLPILPFQQRRCSFFRTQNSH